MDIIITDFLFVICVKKSEHATLSYLAHCFSCAAFHGIVYVDTKEKEKYNEAMDNASICNSLEVEVPTPTYVLLETDEEAGIKLL